MSRPPLAFPTGWAIVLDLIRRIAAVEQADPTPDPERWYFDRFGEAPRYSTLLDKIARTRSERQAIIRGYVEPSEEQRSRGDRLPTKAHHAIAKLAAGGYLRVILTTNFDRLVEQALDEAGLPYQVIDDDDALAGAQPLTQSALTLVKLHGDYRDARIRNTEAELDHYGKKMDEFLDRVLDEYGLIVCGWSADWDRALRSAVERQPSRRYTTFWSSRGEPSLAAQDLIRGRRAELIPGRDADQFFVELESKVAALADFERPHPLSLKIATAELKRFLPEPQSRIRLTELVMGEADRAASASDSTKFPAEGSNSVEATRERIARYQAAVEVSAALLIAGATYGELEHQTLWSRAIARLCDWPEAESGLTRNIALRRYPALVCVYAAGIASVAAEKWGTLYELFFGVEVRSERTKSGVSPLVGAVNPATTFQDIEQTALLPEEPPNRQFRTPISVFFHKVLREPLREVLPSDSRYTDNFDRFEFLLGATLVDRRANAEEDYYLPHYFGSFAYRYDIRGKHPAVWLSESHDLQQRLLQAGHFGGESSRLLSATAEVAKLSRGLLQGWG